MILGHQLIVPGTGHGAGRQLLTHLYHTHIGSDMPAIRTSDRGKPYFENSGVYFSISHTKHHVFCVLSDCPVGIDAEEADRKIDLRLAKKILSSAEYERYTHASDKQQCLLRFWILKEADAKCSGDGIKIYPNHTDFHPEDPRIQSLHGCLVAVIEKPCNTSI